MQSAFAEGVAAGKVPYQASLDAGYKSTSAASKMMADDRMRDALKAAAIRAGLTTERIGAKLQALADAQRFELSRDGSPVHLGPDNRAQLQAMDIVIKMLGGYPKNGVDVDLSTQNVLVIDSARSPLAALDPFSGTVIEGEVSEPSAPSSAPVVAYNPDGGIPPEDDFQVG
ncbi:MAG: hypothetical protein IPL77_22040 [Flavobacteriales bacterium]|nr:hypothetical protein [Flavobacteriales bacterium]